MKPITKTSLHHAAWLAALGAMVLAGPAAAQSTAPNVQQAPPAAAPAPSAGGPDRDAMKAEMRRKMEASGMDPEAMKAEMKKRMASGGHDHDAMKAQMKEHMQHGSAPGAGKSSAGHSHGSAAPAAGGAHDHGSAAEETAYGRAGDAKKVSRTVTIRMTDAMRFTPSVVNVRQGETIRFVVRNEGRQKHELVIGTAAELKEHAEAMKKHPDMEHEDHAQAVHLNAGRRGAIVWQFTKAGEFDFACLVPGHFEAGMVGRIIVMPAASSKGPR